MNMVNHLDIYLFIHMLSLVNHLYKHGKPLRHVLIYSCHTQLTTYINMENHLYEHGKPLKHIRIYSDVILS